MTRKSDPCQANPPNVHMLAAVWVCILACVLPARAAAHTRLTPTPTLRVVRTDRAPRIDGRPTERVWDRAPVIDAFFQTSPNPGRRASERTMVKVLYDDSALYVAFFCTVRKGAAVRSVRGERDQIPESDRVEVMLDPFHDHRSGYKFMVNAAGTLADGLISNDNQVDLAWDEVWTAKVSRDKKGWTAEFRIPLSSLRFPHGKRVMTWGAQFRRYISRLKEVDDWSYVPRGSGRLASIFGHLTGFARLKGKLRFMLRPYLSLRGQAHRASGSLSPKRPFWFSSGVDLKYGLTSALTLDLTVNPDFAQVELDPAIVNLTRYEVWLPEKRPFFLEGAENFKTPFTLLYTRRIGAAPAQPDPTHPQGTIEELDQVAPIWTALKLTGRPARNWSMGVMSAVVGPTRAAEGLPDRRLKILEATPTTHIVAARVRRHFARASAVGVMATAAQAPDLEDAYVASVDVDVRDLGSYRLTAQAVGSAVGSDPQLGYGFVTGGGRTAAAGFRWYVQWLSLSKHLELNRTGFLSRPDLHQGSAWVSYLLPRPTSVQREMNLMLGVYAGWNHKRQTITRGLWTWCHHQFRNTWLLQYSLDITLPSYDDWNTYSPVAFRRPHEYRPGFSVRSDTRKFLYATLSGWVGRRGDRGLRGQASLAVTLRAGRAVRVSVASGYKGYRRWAQWVETVDRNGTELPVYGPMNMDQVDLSLKTTVSFLNTLTFQLYAQYLHAAARFPENRYYLLTTPTRREPVRWNSANWDTDVFKVHARLRWEYRTGCRLFIVYTHLSDVGGSEGLFSVEESWKRLGWETADDIIMVKLDYEWRT